MSQISGYFWRKLVREVVIVESMASRGMAETSWLVFFSTAIMVRIYWVS